MTEPGLSNLSFERADLAPSTPTSCASCNDPIVSTYYGWGGNSVCPACHQKLAGSHAKSGSFVSALVLGGVAAALGAAAYYGIAALTGMEFGLIAIVVGIVVGKAVRVGAGSYAKKRYRALAVLLTYASITATYVPFVLEGAPDMPVVGAAIFAFVLPGMMLMDLENLLGLIILAIGVYEGWKFSAPPDVVVQGPFTLANPQSQPASEQAAAPLTSG
jgi:hypothetical protein